MLNPLLRLALLAPTPSPASTPTASPSPSVTQLPSLLPTPVATPSPIVVVTDQGHDWFDFLGIGLSTLVGLIGLFLAYRAYRVGANAYRVAKEQGRRTFELEIMRELTTGLDSALIAEKQDERNNLLPGIGHVTFSRLPLLPKDELPLWRMVDMYRDEGDGLTDIRAHEGVQELSRDDSSEEFSLAVINALYDEIHEAMRKRTE